jgi:hypothetical protein
MPPTLDVLDVLATVLLGISLGVERLLSIVKTLAPRLTEEKKTAAGEVDLVADRPRRMLLQVLAFVASWVTCGLLFDSFNPFATVDIGGRPFAIVLLALLGSGGSALWNNVLGFTKGLKDQRRVLTAEDTLRFHEAAQAAGKPARDSGATARVPGGDDRIRKALAELRTGPAPTLVADTPRGNVALLRRANPPAGGA